MYTFEIKEYRAVKEARIRIDGITVLAGINSSGKSTLSRWLYYLVNAIHNFELHQRCYFIDSLETEIQKIYRVFRVSPKGANYRSIINQIRHYKFDKEYDLDSLKNVYYSFVKKAENDLRDLVDSEPFNKRLVYYLYGDIASSEINEQDVIETYIKECLCVFENGMTNYFHKIETCSVEDLDKVIMSEYSDGQAIPLNISFIEGETLLFGGDRFFQPLMLSRAIYIDSPMTVSGTGYTRVSYPWSDLHYYLYTENIQKINPITNRLNLQIQSIIGGSIQLMDDKFNLEKELRYINQVQGININLNEVATGIKSFAYMSQLLNNGWLDKETLLLIDEPEAHLHPQWIVEFARLLVNIHKHYGVKILVASHNPDMVAAIQSISNKENILDKTVFYLAEKEKDQYRYSFIDKSTDIADIFASFNIAISRIEMYGTPII